VPPFVRPIVFLLLINIVLAVGKLTLGWQEGSTALRSDGWNNAADVFYTLLIAAGLWISVQPPDRSHPEGHGRFESLVGLGVSGVILLTGAAVVADAVLALRTFSIPHVGAVGMLVLSVSMGLKFLIGRRCLRVARQQRYPALEAIGRDQITDVLVDASVLTAVGAAALGAGWLDPVVASIIGLLILHLGWRTLRESVDYLTGRSPSPELLEKIREQTRDIEVFSEPFHIRAHYVGPRVHLSLNVASDRNQPLERIHDAEETLRARLLALEEVSRVFIHVEPHGAKSPN